MGLMFGVHLPIHGAYSYEFVLKAALLAEELGFRSIWVGDHFFLPPDTYRKTGGDPSKPDKLDAWTTLAALATKTNRVTVGTRVSPIPFYHPGRLAKIVTTLDIISGGRVILGAGAGWHKAEAVSYGIPWLNLQKRIERMMEGLEIIVRLCRDERVSYEGKYYSIKEAPFFPKPLQKPHPPIWIGGSSLGILKATAKIGDGWVPSSDMPPRTFGESASKIKELAESYGRDPSKISLAAGVTFPTCLGKEPSRWGERVEMYFKNGAQHILIDLSQSLLSFKQVSEFLRLFARHVLPSY
ncbi:MAG: LLM class flavin-dependent oxidoreductase [Candidatus Bathyarchaeia archaeon]